MRWIHKPLLSEEQSETQRITQFVHSHSASHSNSGWLTFKILALNHMLFGLQKGVWPSPHLLQSLRLGGRKGLLHRLWRCWRTPWVSSSGLGPGVAGRLQLSGSFQGAGARPGGHAELEMGCPAPWAPCLLHWGIQLLPAPRFPSHATFSSVE